MIFENQEFDTIYVDSRNGDDRNLGFSVKFPKKTFNKAIRALFKNKVRRILLAKNSVFVIESIVN